MARPSNHRRDDAIEAIRKLSSVHGIKEGCRLAREQFHDVPRGTWCRWRQQAVGTMQDGASFELKDAVVDIRREIPSPEQLLNAVPSTHRALNFWRMLDELEHDAQLLRDYAIVKGTDGKIKVRVPFALRDAHRMRCDLIRIAIQQAESAWSVERTQSFFDTLVEEVGTVSPDCQRRIIERLRVLSGERGARGF